MRSIGTQNLNLYWWVWLKIVLPNTTHSSHSESVTIRLI